VSKHLLAFLLSEMNTIRLRCKRTDCGAVTEVLLNRMPPALRADFNCPCCHKPFHPHDKSNFLDKLARAVDGLKACKEDLAAEFIVLVKDAGEAEEDDPAPLFG
jgi:hypothetical protein